MSLISSSGVAAPGSIQAFVGAGEGAELTSRSA